MQNVVKTVNEQVSSHRQVDSNYGYNSARTLAAYTAHLNRSGKICLKPWCWRRFYLLFRPGFEPPWLSSWWTIPNHEKKDLFLKQLEYLAYRTDRFDAAHRFLRGLPEENWLFGPGASVLKPDQR